MCRSKFGENSGDSKPDAKIMSFDDFLQVFFQLHSELWISSFHITLGTTVQ